MSQKPQSFKRAKNPNTPEATSKYYLTNSKLLPAVKRSKEAGKLSDELAGMLMMLTKKYAQRPCFSGYTYKEDMISEALTNLCQNALKFNTDKYDNPFAYYTTCINSSFLQFLNVEKKHRRIRDQLLVDIGENPSYSFTNELSSQQSENGEYKSELTELKGQIEEARDRVKYEAEQKVIADAELARLAEEAKLIVSNDIAELTEINETETELIVSNDIAELTEINETETELIVSNDIAEINEIEKESSLLIFEEIK